MNKTDVSLIIDSIYIIFGGSFNLIVIIIYLLNYKTYLSICSLLMLSIINLICSIVLIPVEIAHKHRLIENNFAINASINFFSNLCTTQAFFLLALISLERYQNISSLSVNTHLQPFHIRSNETHRCLCLNGQT